MRIQNVVLSTFFFVAEISSISLFTSAFTLNSFSNSNSNSNRPSTLSSTRSIISSVGTSLSAIVGEQQQQPCDVPSDIEEVVLKDSKSIRNAIVTNVDGEQITIGDMMGTTQDDMTSVVVFLRHMG
mmetsp:Transcript_31406/g.35149  ORF Transcript_31406/g.35149 Transcript_31406/m.35149 type:complete len:126 (-) Transcript_31406:855-1232(-)